MNDVTHADGKAAYAVDGQRAVACAHGRKRVKSMPGNRFVG